MIEKGMLNSMDTPPPRGSGKRLDFIRQAGKHSPGVVDVESQVRYFNAPRINAGSLVFRGLPGGQAYSRK